MSKKEAKPTLDRLFVKRDELDSTEDKSAVKIGSIFITQTEAEIPQEGTVIAVGPKVENVFCGNRVLFGKFAGTEVTIDGQKLLIMKEEEILAVL